MKARFTLIKVIEEKVAVVKNVEGKLDLKYNKLNLKAISK